MSRSPYCEGCGAEIAQPPGRGRPRKWCSERCKRGRTGPTNEERVERARAEFSAGLRFDRLVVVEYQGATCVLVRCDCGAEKIVAAWDLRYGVVGSCGRAGCARGDRGRRPTHGMSSLPEYKIWGAIKQRILNPACHAYADYGGRGLTMEPDWVDSFEAFIEHVGPRPSPDLSIDRIDNDLGYLRGNLRWATREQQARNTRATRRAA